MSIGVLVAFALRSSRAVVLPKFVSRGVCVCVPVSVLIGTGTKLAKGGGEGWGKNLPSQP